MFTFYFVSFKFNFYLHEHNINPIPDDDDNVISVQNVHQMIISYGNNIDKLSCIVSVTFLLLSFFQYQYFHLRCYLQNMSFLYPPIFLTLIIPNSLDFSDIPSFLLRILFLKYIAIHRLHFLFPLVNMQ